MEEDKTLYSILIIMLILGIIAAFILVKISRQPPEPFSALSFTDPDGLPNAVRLNKEYKYEYSVESFENETRNYEIDSVLEYYRLYDVTEAHYSCLSPYRRKVYLEWTNNTNLTHATINKTNEIIPDLAILPSKADFIDWRKYHFTFSLGRSLGRGEFIIWFGTEEKTNYWFSINQQENTLSFNGEKVSNIEIRSENDEIVIENTGHELKFFYNKNLLFQRNYEDATNGQFGFETRDMFISLGRMQISKYEEIEVPDRENIWEYSVDTNGYYNWLGQARNNIQKKITLTRVFIPINEPEARMEIPATEDIIQAIANQTSAVKTCKNEFACNYLNIINETTIVNEENITSLLLSLPVTSSIGRYWLNPSGKDAAIPWHDFDATITHQTLEENGSITLAFNENFGVLFTSMNYFIIKKEQDKLIITKHRAVTSNETVLGNITISARGNSITISKAGTTHETILNESLYNFTPRIFHANTFNMLREIKIENTDEKCGEEEVYSFCQVIYSFAQNIPVSRPPNPNLYGSVVERDPFVFSTSNESEIRGNENSIPGKEFSFDGPLTRIGNRTNLTLSTSYLYLEGEGNITIGIKDDEGNVIFSATSIPQENKIIITEKGRPSLVISQYLDESEWQPMQIVLNRRNNRIIYNNTAIATYYNDIVEGHFFIEIENMHAELRNVNIRNQDTGVATNIPLLDDPCRLRTVGKQIIRKENFSLEPGIKMNFSETITLDTFFDYALLKVNLNGSSGTNNTALSTQFWMVRQ